MWLHDAGYHTGLIGKYLNGYPFGRAPYIPPGWDRWVAKQNADDHHVLDYGFVDQGVARHSARCRRTTRPTSSAAGRRLPADAPADQPFFLYFSPSAPHLPWTPAPRYAGAFADVLPPIPPLDVLERRRGKPA